MKIKLAADLEKALLRSIAAGVCQSDVVAPDELSKDARIAYESICHLFKRKVKPPLKGQSILLTAQSLFGVDTDEYKSYLKTFKDVDVGEEVVEIAKTAREKALLVRLINEAGQQLAQGHLDPRELARLMESNDTRARNPLAPMAMSVQDKFPEPPSGIPIQSLPTLSDTANGLMGVWIIGGEPGLGKSTLAFQLGLDAARECPVLYYDLDGTGYIWLQHRVRKIAGDDIRAFKKLTKLFHLRETIDSLDDDIASIREEHSEGPIVAVIDSIQTLPTSIKYKKESFDGWIVRFKQLSKKGIVIIGVSEQNRANYGEPRMAGFKGSGDIEYAGSVCMQLLQPEGAHEDDPVQVHIVKNRHGKHKGHIVDIVRDKKKQFWFQEEEV